MATLECDFCDESEASLILTNLQNGDVTRVCGACFPSFVLTLAEALGIAAQPETEEDDEESEESTDDNQADDDNATIES